MRSMRGSINDPPNGGSHPFSDPGWTASRCAGASWRHAACLLASRLVCYHEAMQQAVPSRLQKGILNVADGRMRHAGICDDEVAQCYCNGTKGRIEAPAGSPPGAV